MIEKSKGERIRYGREFEVLESEDSRGESRKREKREERKKEEESRKKRKSRKS